MHPRICVSGISTFGLDLTGDLEFWSRHGIDAVGISVAKLEAHGWRDGVARVQRSSVRVANLIGLGPFRLHEPSDWEPQRDRLHRALDAASTLDAGCVVCTTGPAGPLRWEEAADEWETAMGPVLEDARGRGVRLALEHTNPLRVDVGFVHTLRDAVDLARRVGVGVCMEVQACWAERDLAATVRDAADQLTLVQVSDFTVGTTTTPDRVVPGDGDIPLGRVLESVLDSGYRGDFDLEVLGPRIDEEGYDAAIPRAVDRLGTLLDELGV